MKSYRQVSMASVAWETLLLLHFVKKENEDLSPWQLSEIALDRIRVKSWWEFGIHCTLQNCYKLTSFKINWQVWFILSNQHFVNTSFLCACSFPTKFWSNMGYKGSVSEEICPNLNNTRKYSHWILSIIAEICMQPKCCK